MAQKPIPIAVTIAAAPLAKPFVACSTPAPGVEKPCDSYGPGRGGISNNIFLLFRVEGKSTAITCAKAKALVASIVTTT